MAVDYSLDEIREELGRMGYRNVPEDKLHVFKKRLIKLIESEKGKSMSSLMASHYPASRSQSLTTYGALTTGSNANQMFQENDYKWHSMERSKSVTFSPSVESQSKQSKARAVNRGHYSASDIRPEQNEHMLSDHFALTSPNSDFKSKVWNWTMSSDGNVDDNAETFQNDGDYEHNEDEMSKKTRKGKQNGKGGSADSGPQFGKKGVYRNPSGIILQNKQPHESNLGRSKVLERHQMYQRFWKLQPPIGEHDRLSLRWAMRDKLNKQKEEPPKCPSKSMIPNTYVVPSTKPRLELRWAVRQCIEHHQMPPCGFFHEA